MERPEGGVQARLDDEKGPKVVGPAWVGGAGHSHASAGRVSKAEGTGVVCTGTERKSLCGQDVGGEEASGMRSEARSDRRVRILFSLQWESMGCDGKVVGGRMAGRDVIQFKPSNSCSHCRAGNKSRTGKRGRRVSHGGVHAMDQVGHDGGLGPGNDRERTIPEAMSLP